jgi:hypothetical protein
MTDSKSSAKHTVEPSRLLKFVALVQIPLILVAVFVYAYVLVSLRPLLQQREDLKKEIEQSAQQRESLKQEIVALEKSVKVLREESDRYRASLQRGPTVPETPITALVYPRADRRETSGKMPDGRPLYEFSAWIEGPENVLGRITSVQYEFNHPTFRNPVMRSTNRGDGFRVRYTGWGCLASVIVTFTLKDPKAESPRLDFDMCAAIWGGK